MRQYSNKTHKNAIQAAKAISNSLQKQQQQKFRRDLCGEATLSFLLGEQENGDHFFSPKVARGIANGF
jgi:hypothetical protein